MKKLFLLLLFLTVSAPQQSWALTTELETKALALQKLINEFKHLCMSSDGKVLSRVVHVDKDNLNGGPVMDCRAEALRLVTLGNQLRELRKLHEAKSLECLPTGEKVISDKVGENIENIQTASLKADVSCKEQSISECAKDIGCNLIRFSSALDVFGMNKAERLTSTSTCANSKQNSCAGELLFGIIKDLKFNGELITGLYTSLKRSASSVMASWGLMDEMEDEMSDAAHAASQQSESMVDLFKKDKVGFIKALAQKMWQDLSHFITHEVACETWEGQPHQSKCVQPMSSWGCATCNQKTNAICGAAGVLTGELISGYIMGFGTAGALRAGKAGLSLMKKGSDLVAKSIPRVRKILPKVSIPGKFITPFTKGIELAEKVLESQTFLALKAFAASGTQQLKLGASSVAKKVKGKTAPAVEMGKKIAHSAPVTITYKIAKGALRPVGNYFKLMDQFFNAGFSHGNTLVNKGRNLTKTLPEIIAQNEKTDTVSEIIVNSRQFEDVSQDVIRQRLRDEGVPFEEVVLKDGTPATRVSLPPECNKGRASFYIFK